MMYSYLGYFDISNLYCQPTWKAPNDKIQINPKAQIPASPAGRRMTKTVNFFRQ